MKESRILTIALATAASGFAQQTPLYCTSTFFHVADGKGQAYVEYSKAHTRKMMELALKEDPAFPRSCSRR